MMPTAKRSSEEKVTPEPLSAADLADEAEAVSEEAADQLPGSRWRGWGYGLVASLVLVFGVGREPWAKGLALILMGLAVFLMPPRFQLRTLPKTALIWLGLAGGAGLLPAGWTGALEEWRVRLVQEWSVAIPGTVSAEPLTTLESWLILIACLVWFWACIGQNFRTVERRIVLRVLSLTVLIIAVLSLLERWQWLPIPWWPRGEQATLAGTYFGPFANRNHTSSLFALASVLCGAAAYDAFRQRSRLWLVFGLGILFLLVGIMVNSSRAGLALFFLGMTLWLVVGLGSMKRGMFRRLLVGLALVIGVLSMVMVSGGTLGERLTAQPVSTMLGSDLRLWMARETLDGFMATPWLGRGLGMFRSVFPQVSLAPFPDARPNHPESDVLWLLFEGGLLCLIPCLLLVYWMLTTTGPWLPRRKKKSRESRSGRRARKAFAIAAGVALVHSIFDVPLHGIGYFLVFALCVSQAIRSRYIGGAVGRFQAGVFRLAGLAMVAFGCHWVALAAGWTDRGLAAAAPVLHDKAVAEAAKGRRAEALALINRAVELTPLQFRWYYLRAQLLLAMGRGSQAALLDFGRVRALEPRFGPVCMDEGRYWLHYDPPMALIPWREGIRRYPPGFANAVPQYQEIVIAAEPYPEVLRPLWKLADRTSLQLIYFSRPPVGGDLWQQCLDDFLHQHPGLEGLNRQEITFLFHLWQTKGDSRQLLAYLKKHPRLVEFGWKALAFHEAQSGRFEAAYKLAARYIPAPARSATLMASDVPRLERAFLFNPVDPLPGVELYYAQRAAGDLKSARQTLEKVMRLPGAPTFLKRELASVLADAGDLRAAWEIMREIVDGLPMDLSVRENAVEEAQDNLNRPSAPPPRNSQDSGWDF